MVGYYEELIPILKRRTDMGKSLAAQLTSREMARVAKVTTARIGRNTKFTHDEYLAELWVTARNLYPSKIK